MQAIYAMIKRVALSGAVDLIDPPAPSGCNV